VSEAVGRALSWTPPGGPREVAPLRRLVEVTLCVAACWRMSGNLGVSGTTHSVIDSVRNAIGDIP
jgi:hypothetical protein